jgi:hypothetical protein
MKSYNLEVIDASTILHELFPGDEDSREQIIAEIAIADWSYGANAYSLIHVDGFLEFLQACVDNEIWQTLTRDKIEQVWISQYLVEKDIYINLEMQ